MKEPKIEVKNVKIAEFASDDSLCFECSVYVNGKRAFIAKNDGNGGCNFYHPVNEEGKALLKLCEDWTKTLPEEKHTFGSEDFYLQPDLDIILGDLIQNWEEDKYLKRNCKTKTVFRLPEYEKGAYSTYNRKYDDGMKRFVLLKHPDAEIINERYL